MGKRQTAEGGISRDMEGKQLEGLSRAGDDRGSETGTHGALTL